MTAGCASDPNAPSPELLLRIGRGSRTRSDHEALVTYYDREATVARASAAEHRKMARSYQGMTGSGRGGSSMPAHCNSMVSLYESIAVEYDGLAGDHRPIAARAQP